jgi:CubicO group peptidase (beta-lactamase class C family)
MKPADPPAPLVRCHASLFAATMLALGALHLAPAACAQNAPDTTSTPRDISALLEPIHQEHDVPALAAALVKGDQVVAIGAVGVLKVGSKRPVSIESRFHIGSCTKSMTATLMAMLVEEGLLRWDTTLAEALPQLSETMHPDYRRVTITQLLSHHAGVPAYTQLNPEEFKRTNTLQGTPAEQRYAFAAAVLAEPPAFPPGEKMNYSNAGYGIAGCILERLTGRSWDELMTERLFKPLGMNDSGFGWPASDERRREPRGHRPTLLGVAPEPLRPGYKLPACLAPAGDVHCTIGDFARYASFHLCGLTGHARLLKPETFAYLHTVVGEGEPPYALGWAVAKGEDGVTTHNHAGSAGTFYAVIRLEPERNRAMVAATNLGGDTASAACTAAVKRLIESADDLSPAD